MKNRGFGFAVGMLLIAVVAGCAPPAATPIPVPAATAVPPTAQVIAVGFTPAAVCSVPNVVGLDQSMAQNMLAKLGLQPVLSNQYDASIAVGAVISQKPAAGTRLEPCKQDVEIVVSLGPIPTLTPRPATATPEATATPKPSATPTNPPPTSTPDNRLFWDDFANGLKPEWQQVSGRCTMVDERLQCPTLPFRLEVGDYGWTNYRLEFDTGEYWKFHPALTVMVHLAPDGSYFALKLPDCGNLSWSYGRPDGKEESVAGTSGGVCEHGPFHIEIECRGDLYTAKINGQLIGTVQDSRAPSGRIGISSAELSPWFDNVVVTALQ